MSVNAFSDFTLDVGTRLYIAPEILSKRGGRDKDHSKADLYSLGVRDANGTTAQFCTLTTKFVDRVFRDELYLQHRVRAHICH